MILLIPANTINVFHSNLQNGFGGKSIGLHNFAHTELWGLKKLFAVNKMSFSFEGMNLRPILDVLYVIQKVTRTSIHFSNFTYLSFCQILHISNILYMLLCSRYPYEIFFFLSFFFCLFVYLLFCCTYK
jgi:hypothetical protein